MLVGELEGVNRVDNFFKLQIFNLIYIIERIINHNFYMFRKDIKKYISSYNAIFKLILFWSKYYQLAEKSLHLPLPRSAKDERACLVSASFNDLGSVNKTGSSSL